MAPWISQVYFALFAHDLAYNAVSSIKEITNLKSHADAPDVKWLQRELRASWLATGETEPGE
jgi:hypothetical protein